MPDRGHTYRLELTADLADIYERWHASFVGEDVPDSETIVSFLRTAELMAADHLYAMEGRD